MSVITNNDYEKSVLLVGFLNEVKATASEKGITDMLYTPFSDGYKVSFAVGEKSIFITAEVKGFFFKKLIVRKYVDHKETVTYKAHNKEELSRYIELIFS